MKKVTNLLFSVITCLFLITFLSCGSDTGDRDVESGLPNSNLPYPKAAAHSAQIALLSCLLTPLQKT